MSWLRRLLLLAGLLTGAWLLGGAGEAHADVKIEIDQLKIAVELPVVEIALKVETAPEQPEPPVPPKPAPRVETTPEAPAPPQAAPERLTAPVRAEVPQQRQEAPAPPEAAPEHPAPVPQPQQAEQPVPGTLPQSGAGTSTSTQTPVGTLPCTTRPPTTTVQLTNTEHHDVPHTVRAEEPTFSPD
ncbi:hypothetical protein ACFWNN_24895 [Lentzea sp. NPDC058450]|uniref:hypothetical protein n=1 Tax=Lentzea sp. NPDC058450 TaxID=3346505 RepID=UPI00365E2831